MNTIRSLFSFEGEIGRGSMWLTYLRVGSVGLLATFMLVPLARFVGDPQVAPEGGFAWPSLAAGWGVFAAYWFIHGLLVWIFLASMVKRLRECSIAPKWLIVFVALMALSSGAMSELIHEGDIHLSPLAWFALVFLGFPTAILGFWLFGSVFLAPSSNPHRFDTDRLPKGWK